MQSKIPFIVGLDDPHQFELTLHRVVGQIFKDIELVVVGISTIGLEIDVPFAVQIVKLGSPDMKAHDPAGVFVPDPDFFRILQPVQ